jgi:predicted transposase/invertase (TIGR01784 family)
VGGGVSEVDGMNENIGVKPNREYKNTLFRKLFGEKGTVLELYNAIRGTNYGPDTNMSMVTLDDTMYIGPLNDVSFTIDNNLVVLIEHQSTVNENMPLRMLQYIAKSYEKLTDDADKYKCKRIKIPRPEFIVLYNGEEEVPDMVVLKLSEMFAECDMEYPYNLEVIVRVYNINKGRNPEMARRSATLNGYEVYTAKVREYRKTMSFEQAVDRATEECIKENMLVEFLKIYRKAVHNMITAEWSFEDALKVRTEEVWQEGLQKGRQEGRQENLNEIVGHMYKEGFDIADIAKAVKLSEQDINGILGL